MSTMIVPLLWISIPCVFNKPKDKESVDLSELGIPEIESETETDLLIIQLDQINAYTHASELKNKDRTIMWAFGYNWLVDIPFRKFDEMIKAKTKELNLMMCNHLFKTNEDVKEISINK